MSVDSRTRDFESSSSVGTSSIIKSDLIQLEAGHGKAILMSELKKDIQVNIVFEEIQTEFYLLVIMKDLFIENSTGFKATLKQLASDAFTKLEIPPFELTDSLISMVSMHHIYHWHFYHF